MIIFLVIHAQNLVDVVLVENSLSPIDCLDAALDFQDIDGADGLEGWLVDLA